MLLEAQVTAFLGALLLLGAFVLAHQRFRSEFSWYWIAGWAFYIVRFAFDIAGTVLGQGKLVALGMNISVATSAILILLAVMQLGERDQPAETGAMALWGLLVGWAAVAIGFDLPFVVVYTPLYVSFGLVQLVTAYLFYQYLKRHSYSSTPLIIASLVIWGLHKFDYPLLRPIESLAPYGYILGALLSFTTGLGVMMFLLEDAERKASKERNIAVRRFEEYEQLFNNIPDPVFIHDLDGNFLHVNETAVEVYDYTEEEFQSMTPADLVSQDQLDEIEDRIELAGKSDQITFDSKHITADGRTIDVAVNAAKITYRGQSAILAIARDVTERHDLEQTLSVLNRILRHDIRSSVTIIKGNAEIAHQSAECPEDPLDTVIDEAERLYEIGENAQKIEQLLSSEDTAIVQKDLSTLLDTEVEALEQSYPNVSIERNIQENLSAKVAVNFGDVIENVLMNAVIHNDKEVPEIDVEASAEDDQIEIRIADNGPGIPRDEIEPIEAGKETDLQHTSGLGLWLVYWMVEESNGDLEFSDNDPTGTVVRICVPKV